MRLLLDGCTFLWLTLSPERIPEHSLKAIRDKDNGLFLSAATAWELSIKYGLGRLDLPEPPEQFIVKRRDMYAIESLPIGEADAVHTGLLPRLHNDPFDRLLVSQSIVHGMTIATPDERIRQYPCRVIWD